jgi:hypothetical protein
MKLYPGMTVSLWLNGLAPVFGGDSLDLNEVDVTFAIADSEDTIVVASGVATQIGESFRRIVTLPSSPGRYVVLTRAVSGTSVYRSATDIRILPAADEIVENP